MNQFYDPQEIANILIERATLERIEIVVQSKLDRFHLHGLHTAGIHGIIDNITDQVCLQFRAYVLGETQKPIVIYTEFGSWWQMFKNQYAPRWFKRAFPVKRREVTVDCKVIYPDLKVSIPQNMSRVVVLLNQR